MCFQQEKGYFEVQLNFNGLKKKILSLQFYLI